MGDREERCCQPQSSVKEHMCVLCGGLCMWYDISVCGMCTLCICFACVFVHKLYISLNSNFPGPVLGEEVPKGAGQAWEP